MIPTELDTLLAIVNLGWSDLLNQRDKRMESARKLPVEQLPQVADAIDQLLRAEGFPYPNLDDNPDLHALWVLGTALQGQAAIQSTADLEPTLEMVRTFVLYTSGDRDDIDQALAARFLDHYVAIAMLSGYLTETALGPGVTAHWDLQAQDWRFELSNVSPPATPLAPAPTSFGWMTDLSNFQEQVLIPLLAKYVPTEPVPPSAESSGDLGLFLCRYCGCIMKASERYKDQGLCRSCADDLRQLESEH